jgi:hypothetical protein
METETGNKNRKYGNSDQLKEHERQTVGSPKTIGTTQAIVIQGFTQDSVCVVGFLSMLFYSCFQRRMSCMNFICDLDNMAVGTMKPLQCGVALMKTSTEDRYIKIIY